MLVLFDAMMQRHLSSHADMRPEDLANPWAFYRGFIDRAVNDCVSTMAPKWQSKISGFDVWIYDQCATMEQSVRID